MSKENKKPVEYVSDAAWILALWKLIHGGDPRPNQAAGQAIASLTAFLTGTSSSGLPIETLQERLKPLGITVTKSKAKGAKGQKVVKDSFTLGPVAAEPFSCPEGYSLVCFTVTLKEGPERAKKFQICSCMQDFYPPTGQVS